MSNSIYAMILALLLCYQVQCLPLETESKTVSEDALHLYVHNSTKNVNYHISSLASELDDIDEEIAKELDTLLPYLNFLVDVLWGQSGDTSSNGDECVMNDMIIQLVPENSDRPIAA